MQSGPIDNHTNMDACNAYDSFKLIHVPLIQLCVLVSYQFITAQTVVLHTQAKSESSIGEELIAMNLTLISHSFFWHN